MDELENNMQISKEFTDTIYAHIPKKWIAGNGSSGINFHASMSEENKSYKSSEYYYEGEMRFVHWTSVQNLLSIINTRQIRLYNLHNSSDPEEFNYAVSQLNLSDIQKDHSKNFMYTFSFSEIKEKENSYHWEKYGNNYKGVSIEFEIVNNPDEWDNFMLAPVYYEIPQKITSLIEGLYVLKEKYQVLEFDFDLGKLIAFHKNPKFKEEKEIRLSSYFPFDSTQEYWRYCNTEFRLEHTRPRITNYFGLDLWVDNDSFFIKNGSIKFDRQNILDPYYYIKKPKILITNISFGEECGITKTLYPMFRMKLEEVIRLKLGYKVNLPLFMQKVS